MDCLSWKNAQLLTGCLKDDWIGFFNADFGADDNGVKQVIQAQAF